MSKGKEENIYGFEGIRKSEIISALRNHCTPIILLGKRNLLFHLFLPLNLDSKSSPLYPLGTCLKFHLVYIKCICKLLDQSHRLLPAKWPPQVKLCLAEPSLTPRWPFPAWARGPPPDGAFCPSVGERPWVQLPCSNIDAFHRVAQAN